MHQKENRGDPFGTRKLGQVFPSGSGIPAIATAGFTKPATLPQFVVILYANQETVGKIITKNGNVLIASFPYASLDPVFYQDYQNAFVFFSEDNAQMSARIGSFESVMSSLANQNPVTQSMQLTLVLHSVKPKDVWELEYLTEETFVKQYIVESDKFFSMEGASLDNILEKLGLKRKPSESDNTFKRRALAYFKTQVDFGEGNG